MFLFFDLGLGAAILSALGLALIFVLSMYIWPQKYDRNHPTCVKQRMISAILVTTLSPLYLCMLGEPTSNTDHYILHWVGLRDPTSVLIPLALSLTLFIGPLFQCYTTGDNLLSDYDSYSDILLIRNLVVAPITEEIVFRGCLSPLLFKSLGWTATIFFQPLFFGVAHLHHGYQRLRKGESPGQVLATILLQTAFTSLFGAFSTLVFLTTGSVIGPIICHSFCNCMGFPSFDLISLTPQPKLTWLAYICGLVGFVVLTPTFLNCDNFNSLYCNI